MPEIALSKTNTINHPYSADLSFEDSIPPIDYIARGGEGPWQIAETLKADGFFQTLSVQQLYAQIKFWNAIDDNGVKAEQRIKVAPPPAYTVPAGKYAYSAAQFYLGKGYFQGVAGRNTIEKSNALAAQIQKWPSAANWRFGLVLTAPAPDASLPMTLTRTWTVTDTGGKAATSSTTAPVFAQSAGDQPVRTGAGDNFSKPVEAAPNGSAWVYPSVRDQRMDLWRVELGDYLGWDGFDQGAEFLSGFEVGCKVKIRTVDRKTEDGTALYKGRSGNWQTSGGWTWLDRALEQIPWYKRFNEKFGGVSASVGFRPMRLNAGDPRVRGDGYISTEAPRWEVELKAGSLLATGAGELFALAAGGTAAPGATVLANKIGKLPVNTLNRLSVQVSDYVLYDNPLGGEFTSDAAAGQDFKRGDLIRYGLKYELPFKVLGRDSSIKARFNAKGEFLGVDFQIYNKQWDENLAQAATSRIPGGQIFKRWAEHMRSTPELSAESGINFPIRFYRDADNNLYMRFPLLSGVLRLGTEEGAHLKQVMAAAAITPEFDPNIQNEPEVDFHDLSVIKLPEMDVDPIAMFDKFGAYANDPRAAAIADGVSAMAGSTPEEAKAARDYMADLSNAVWTANPVAGGNPLNLVGNVKRWAAGDQFRGNDAVDWLAQNGGADGVLDWLPYAYEGGHLSPYAALNAFRTARDTGTQAVSQDAQRVIDVDAAMGALTTVEHTLQQHAVLGANQVLNGPNDVAVAIDRAKAKYGDGSNAYRAFLRELANPTLDFGHPDLAAMNRVYYAYVNSDLDVPASGMKTMGGRFVWDPECQTRLRPILQEDKEPTARPVPVAQAGVGDWSSPENQLADLPDVDARSFTALEAGEIWQKQPSYAAVAIENILDQGLSTPFELTRAMQNNIPWGGSQTTYDQIAAADRTSAAIKAFDMAQRTMRFMDQWLIDFRRNVMKLPDGETERPRIKNIGTWVDLPTSLVMLKAEYRVKGQLHLYQAHLDMLADILGPSGISFHNADLQQAFARKGYTAPQNEDIARYLYGRNVKAGR